MRRRVDADEGLAEVGALWSAASADELHRVLVLHRPVRRSSDAHEPFSLLQRHHETEPDASIDTTILLLTDRRWRGAIGQLVRMIASSDLLAPDDLDLLAETFLGATGAVYWAVPDEWFSDGVVIVLPDDGAPDDEPGDEPPAVVQRDVWPPLRRWAAERLVRRDPGMWSAVLARVKELDGRAAAAVMCGLLDARGALMQPVQELLVREAFRSGNQGVRRLGYAAMAEQDGAEAACERALHDSNAQVREWAQTVVEAPEEPAKPTLF